MRLTALLLAATVVAPFVATAAETTPPAGPYTSDWATLKQYKCPEWFRDAKFGIWAHWGPQSVPQAGGWYGQALFHQGSSDNKKHVARYGHPSEKGMEAVFADWRAEKWNPEKLMALYKRAGAKYFVSMGVHHDNFDMWDSKYNRWNAVKIGPKQDIVARWQAAAKKEGLKFGVSEHLAASYTWYQSAHGADKSGPKAGIPYVGAKPEFADLYHPKLGPGEGGWYTTNKACHANWGKRIGDLTQTYHPDLVYSDGGLPFGVTGRQWLADFYNDNLRHNGGQLTAVYNCKSMFGHTENNQFISESCVQDLERGNMAGVNPLPWQTDTSIGDWFDDAGNRYRRQDGSVGKYRDAAWVIKALVDTVSKNGNMLMNVNLAADGSIHPEAEALLLRVGDWLAVNGEAIYGTRPWIIHGEGPTKANTGNHTSEDYALTASDVRFTTKGGTLYATALGSPKDNRVAIRALAKPNAISAVRLLGSDVAPTWEQRADALVVTLPAGYKFDIAFTLAITGDNLKPVRDAVSAPVDSNLVLSPADVEVIGSPVVEHQGSLVFVSRWENAADSLLWRVNFPKPGTYRVSTSCIATAPSSLTLECSGQTTTGAIAVSPKRDKYADSALGTITVSKAGSQEVRLRPTSAATWKPILLRNLTLTPVDSASGTATKH